MNEPIGPYRLSASLGSGPLGEVVRAQDTANGREVALKLLSAGVTHSPGFAERFTAVAQAAIALRHPQIVEVYDAGTLDGRSYLAMEFLPTGSLAAFMRSGGASGLPFDLLIDLGRQAAEALAYAHSQNVVHRMIKPSNLLLAGTSAAGYTLKVGDFGQAQLVESDGRTASDVTVGAPAYLSPEQAKGLEPEDRSDLYSLGIVLYEMATGAPPFGATSTSAMIAAHVYTPPPPPSGMRPDIVPELEAIILRCLAKLPEERYRSAVELATALGALGDTFAQDTVVPQAVSNVVAPPSSLVAPESASIPEEQAPTVAPPSVSVSPVAVNIPVPLPPVAPASAPEVLEGPTQMALPVVPLASEPPSSVPEPLHTPIEAAPVAPPLVQNTPLLSGVTQTVVSGTPAPGFPMLPPQKGIPQVQVLGNLGQPIQLLDLTGDGIAIGRASDNQLVFDAETVSEYHAVIDWDGNEVAVTDLGSKNGTLLGSIRLRPQIAQTWEGSQSLQISPFWLRLIPAAMAAQPSLAPGVAPVVAPVVALPPSTVRPAAQRTGMSGVQTTPSLTPPVTPNAPPPPSVPSNASYATGRQRGMSGGYKTPVNVSRIGVDLIEDEMTFVPGQASVVRMTLYNRGPTVDHFTVTALGVPASWIQGGSSALQLHPGANGPTALTVNVPRQPESRADTYPVTIQARSRENPNEAGVASASWTVQPFIVNNLELKPRRLSVWRTGKYTVALTNGGNQPARYTLTGDDDEQALDIQFQHDQLALEPGATARVKLEVQGPIRWFGSSQLRSFTVHAKPEKKGETPFANAQLTQRALIPVWLIPLLILLLAGIAYLLTRPPQIAQFESATPRPIAGTPLTVRWEVSRANQIEIVPLEQTVAPNGNYTLPVSATVPPDLVLRASNFFGTAEATLKSTQIPLPTATISPTVNTPSVAPTTATTVAATVAQEAPTNAPPAAEPTTAVVPTEMSTVPITPTATFSLTLIGRFNCPPETTIVLTGTTSYRNQGYLLYFGRRAVSGGITDSNGNFRAVLRVGQEPPSEYEVSIRLRDRLQPLQVNSYQRNDDEPKTLVEPGSRVIPKLICEVKRITATITPSPADGRHSNPFP